MEFATSPLPATEPPRDCPRCPRLVALREALRIEYPGWWNAPVNAFGDPDAWLGIVGLAPGKHGANRTGRPFTGDASGEWLYRALHRAGFASQAMQVDRNDGMQLRDALITAAVRCAPPGNKPTPDERAACLSYLEAELAALQGLRVIVTLGKIADDTVHRIAKASGSYRSPRAPFKHGAETLISLPGSPDATILASYHPSRQNTNTGVLTEAMLDAIFTRARTIADAPAALEPRTPRSPDRRA